MPLYWLCYLGEDYAMCAGKKVALLLSLLLFSVAANARTCVWVDYENSPAVTVSGHITTHHKLPKGSEQRTGDGPWLILDRPLLAGYQGNCGEWRKIAIVPNLDGEWEKEREAQIAQLRKWANQRVTIEGKLVRFVPALVSPSIFIKITTIKKD